MKNHNLLKAILLVILTGLMLCYCNTKVARPVEKSASNTKAKKIKNASKEESNNVIIINRQSNAADKGAESSALQEDELIQNDTSVKTVNPSLIEKYRRARNVEVYIDVYPIDWEGINRDRGIKPPKEKRQRNSNGSFSRNWTVPLLYGTGSGIWPNMGLGWNQNTGLFPYANINIGSPTWWGPNAFVGWNGANGWNAGAQSPFLTFNNPMMWNSPYYGFQQPFWGYPRYPIRNGRRYQAGYQQGFQNGYYQAYQQLSHQNQNQQSIESKPNQIEPEKAEKSVEPEKPKNPYDYSDGVGGPERYSRNVKPMSAYKVE